MVVCDIAYAYHFGDYYSDKLWNAREIVMTAVKLS